MVAPSTLEFERLSSSSVDALSYADRYRRELNEDEILIEHLLISLYDSKLDSHVNNLMREAGIDRQELVRRLISFDKNILTDGFPESYFSEKHEQITQMPTLSYKMSQAFETAFQLSEESGSDHVEPRHLFEGIFTFPDSDVPDTFPEVAPLLKKYMSEPERLDPDLVTPLEAKNSTQQSREQMAPSDFYINGEVHLDPKGLLPSPNPHFIGRDKILSDIHEAFTSDQISVILTGGTGVGKTSIAVEYIYNYSSAFSKIYWIDASSQSTLETHFSSGNLNNSVIIQKGSGSKPLYVFDNAPDPGALSFILDNLGIMHSYHLLITSRGHNWGEFFGPVFYIENFNLDEVDFFLKKRLGKLFDKLEAFKIMADRSKGLPLYLELFCQKVKKQEIPISKLPLGSLLNDLDQHMTEIIDQDPLIKFTGYHPTPTEPFETCAWIENDAIPVIGQIRGGYRPSDNDSLDAKTQAEILATLLIAKDVQPPFAIGLLGDWGVGKTFFMRLMQEKVRAIAGKKPRPEQTSDYVTRAAQIEFNAWHYVDSDLWASLASHIFDELADELSRGKEEIESIRRRLHRMISSSKRDQSDAQATIDAAQKDRRKSAVDLSQHQEDRAQLEKEYKTLRIKRIWNAVINVKPIADDPQTKDWPDVKKLLKEAEKTAKRMGITHAIENTQEVERVYASLKDIMNRGSGLAVAMASQFTGKGLTYSVPTLFCLVAVVLGWPWIVEYTGLFIRGHEHTLTRWLAPMLQAITTVGALAVWAGKNLQSVSSALAYLEKIREELTKPRINLPKPDKAEKRLKNRIEDFDAQIATEQRRIEEADRRIAEAQAEIQRINSGGLVYDFLEARIQDARYLDRLGLISIIRKDFEKLGVLLNDWNKNHEDIDGGEKDSPKPELDPVPIKRIILYIDDLDRCPPKRVVEVLQAVHLLLAFDLFVVVVAVDARWLERSLNESYNPKNGSKESSPTSLPHHRFNAHNYLEKIFQIPFSLPSMDKDGYGKLVSDMITAPKKQAGMREKRSAEDLQRQGMELTGGSGIESDNTKDDRNQNGLSGTQDSQVTGENEDKENAEEHLRLAEEERRLQQEQIKKAEEERQELERERANKRIEAMLLEDHEETFIKALYPFIATPRLAKRFLNIYRLIRVNAANTPESLKIFIDPEHGEFRAVLVILAMVVGRAEVAHIILNKLSSGNETSFTDWLENILQTAVKEKGPLASHDILNDIHMVIETLNKLNGPYFENDLEVYRKKAFEVGRYSFRSHLLMP